MILIWFQEHYFRVSRLKILVDIYITLQPVWLNESNFRLFCQIQRNLNIQVTPTFYFIILIVLAFDVLPKVTDTQFHCHQPSMKHMLCISNNYLMIA